MSTETLTHDVDSLDGLLDYCEGFVRDYWRGQDAKATFMPQMVAIVPGPDGRPGFNIIALPDAMASEESKQATCRHLSGFLAESKVARYCMMTESWLAKVEREGDEGIRPSERPDRKEVMLLVAADRYDAKGRTLEMRRGDGGRVVALTEMLVALTEMPEMNDMTGKMGGRFATLLWPDLSISQPLDAEILRGFEIALNLIEANPERIDDYEATLREGRRIWGVLSEANEDLRAAKHPETRHLIAHQLAAAAHAAQDFILGLMRGWDRRDGTSMAVDAEVLRDAMKARRRP